MKLCDFFEDNFSEFLITILLLIISAFFLFLTGTGISELILLGSFIIIVKLLKFIVSFYKQKLKLLKMWKLINMMDKKYLFLEMIDRPESNLEKEYLNIMRIALKSMAETVSEANREVVNYRRYIEQWAHEIKSPTVAIELICQNNKNEPTRKIRYQIENIEYYIEQILYYARLGHTEQDYVITELSLEKLVNELLEKNRLLFIYNNIIVDKSKLNYVVCGDKKWTMFVLNQILINCIQYRSKHAKVLIFAENMHDGIKLHIKDNGIGIKQSELERVFEFGFTGSNGRKNANATGMGLYLCKEISQRIGIQMDITSVLNEYTDVSLSFSKCSYIELQK